MGGQGHAIFMNTSLAALQTLALYTGATIVTLAKQTLTQK